MASPALIKKTGLSLVSLAVALLVVELALRVFAPAGSEVPSPRYFVHGETKTAWSPPQELMEPVRLGRIIPDHPQAENVVFMQHAPGFSYAHEYPSNPRGYFDAGNRVHYKTNAQGLRGPEIPAEAGRRRGGHRQIVVLGDSFTYGEGVREPDTFVRLLETAARDMSPEDDVEAFSFGQPGMDTSAEFLFWLKNKSLVRPDLVILAFTPNDAVVLDGQALEKRRIDEEYQALFQPPAGLARYSRLYRLIRTRRTRKKLSAELTDLTVHGLHQRGGDVRTPWEMCEIQLRQLGGDVLSTGAAFMVVVIPMMEKLAGDYPYGPIHDAVVHFCRANGVPVIDLLPAFRGRDAGEFWVHPVDHHPNDVAHRIIGEAIAGDPQFRQLLFRPRQESE